MITSDIRDFRMREQFFIDIYEDAFPMVARFVSHRGGSLEEAKDIFQDALVILYEKIVADKLSVQISYDAYLVGISKHLWLKKFKSDSKEIFSEAELHEETSIPDDFFAEDKHENRLLSLLEHTGKRCLDLLRSFYYDNVSLKDISKTFGFSNERSATVQKHKCIEKIRSTVREKSIHYGDLAE
jgi:RNA polymerase sigma factor (sigma-70 family)